MFFDIFRALCEQKGISPSKATKEIGLSNSITTKWKKTGATPGGDTLAKIADYFGISVDHLLGAESSEAPTPKGERLGDRNVSRILGRDGSDVTKILTDEQLRAFLTMVDHLPEAEDL